MGIKLEIQIALSSANHVIDQRASIITIINEKEKIENDASPHRNSVEERLKKIKEEKPPRFKFVWNPPEKHKTLFSVLKSKGKKETSKIFFYFSIKDGDQRLWGKVAVAENCVIMDAISKGIGQNLRQTIDVRCGAFDFK